MPPLVTPRALQVSLTLKHLAQLGWDCTVLCLAGGSWRFKGHVLDDRLRLRRQGAYREIPVCSGEETLPGLALEKLFSELDWRGVLALWRGRPLWLPGAILAGRRVLDREGPFSVILSFSTPWTSQVIGQALQKASGLPWVAFFSDPLVDSPYLSAGPLVRRILGQVERMTLRDADLVIFPTRRAANLVVRNYPASVQRKVRIIPPGYDLDDLPVIAATSSPAATLRLVHAGTLYGPRSPEALFEALARLNRERPLDGRIELLFVGSLDEQYSARVADCGLRNVVKFSGLRPYHEALAAVAGASVCLLIDAPSPTESVFLPSKIADYLMLRKPILGITPAEGESADLLRRLGCPFVPPDDVGAIARAIESLLQQFQAGSLSVSSEYDRVASEYDIRRTTRLFDEALLEAQRGGPVLA